MATVTLINRFEVPAGREDEFFGLWQRVNVYMQAKPGYLRHTLHRALAPEAPYRFVNVAQWESAAHFQAAHDEGFRALVSQPGWEAFPSHPALYEVVHEGQAEGGSAAA
jgi:heme-degrading monooxygenase HmoA